MDKQLNKVMVVAAFPGYEVNDVLIKNSENGLFEYSYNTEKENAIDSLYKSISENKPVLSLKDIVANMQFFANISDYIPKTKEEVEEQIDELNRAIGLKHDEIGDKDTNPDDAEALTVWQNMIWVLEWSLGKRSNI